MNKAGLVEVIQGVTGGTRTDAEKIMETIIETISKTLKKGEEVAIAGLGIFTAKKRAARQARNPRTGAMVQVAAKVVPKFRASKALKDAVE